MASTAASRSGANIHPRPGRTLHPALAQLYQTRTGKLTVEVRVFGPLNIAPKSHRHPLGLAVLIMEPISPSVVARSKRPSTFQKFDGRANPWSRTVVEHAYREVVLLYDSALLVQPSPKDAVPGLSRSPKWTLRHQEQCCVRASWLRQFHPLGNAVPKQSGELALILQRLIGSRALFSIAFCLPEAYDTSDRIAAHLENMTTPRYAVLETCLICGPACQRVSPSQIMAGPFNGSERPQRQCFTSSYPFPLAKMEAQLISWLETSTYWTAPTAQGLVRTALEEEKSIPRPGSPTPFEVGLPSQASVIS
ncbi:uncharacterized protein FFUJ_00648 [Fusarium fujikuroi IMI 58289]|uniref:Uncharacterized protein n=1 Tax=Gibberella fujikuroi (strain CBS 195.34 / IMI 58289 / NRRL A-6831) TaxID=1279085 RepID=S0DM43_GIBF5|nr:LOW QUALITY PROTEIN: uncharacterized protein FFUJ_00648 [Fusarium fujikuroi IMI 58289]CCT63501.1 uncharacterized protein FFUJ_00648 [Fusarium fujikuroi IMI 58289]